MTATTRKAASGDIPAPVDSMREFYAESAHPLDRGWAADSFSALLGDQSRGAVWPASHDDEPAGYVVLTTRFRMEYGGPDAFIDDLFVRPAYRRLRLARAVLRALFDECRQFGGLYAAFGLLDYISSRGRGLMRRTSHLSLLLSFCAAVGSAQEAKPSATPAPEQSVAGEAGDDVIYREDEVDVKAKRKAEAGVRLRASDGKMPYPLTCPERGETTLSVVVRKSGKVAAVTLVKGSGCAVFDGRTVKDAWKLRFTPALKDGRPVSQEATLVTSYWWARERWALRRR